MRAGLPGKVGSEQDLKEAREVAKQILGKGRANTGKRYLRKGRAWLFTSQSFPMICHGTGPSGRWEVPQSSSEEP